MVVEEVVGALVEVVDSAAVVVVKDVLCVDVVEA